MLLCCSRYVFSLYYLLFYLVDSNSLQTLKSPSSEHPHSGPESIDLNQARTPLPTGETPPSPYFSYDPNPHHVTPIDSSAFVRQSAAPGTRPAMFLPIHHAPLQASLHYTNYQPLPATPPYLQYLPTLGVTNLGGGAVNSANDPNLQPNELHSYTNQRTTPK